MIKIYIQNYFTENMFYKKNKTDNNKQIKLHQQKKIKGIRQCIIIEKKQLSLINKRENKLESNKNKRLPQFNCLLDPLAVI